jgi:hypothetical protein
MADLITGVESRISLEGYRIDREPTTSKNDTTRS